MVKSRFKPWGILAIVMTALLFLIFLAFIYILVSIEFFDGHFFKSKSTLTPAEAIVFILLFLLMQLLIVRTWMMYFFIVNIDTVSNTILFKNIFTRQTSQCGFNDFDGYFEIIAYGSRSGSYKVLYLVKNKKARLIITDYYYANFDEMREALSSITYFGLQKNWRQIIRRALLGKPLLN